MTEGPIEKRGFTCWTNFDVELGGAPDGCRIYTDLDELQRKEPCWAECGVVEVSVRFERMISGPGKSLPQGPVAGGGE